jgi:hypothetical protein
MFTPRSLLCAVLGAAVVFGAVACGSAPSGPSVASLGSGSSPSTSAKPSSNDTFTQMLAFAACMRQHGVKDFPDPQRGSGGGVSLQIKGGPGGDLNPTSSVFQAAQQACQSLMPQGGPGGAKVDPTKIEPWAACMRSHGLPNFPDPTTQNGALKLDMSGTGVNPGSPAFQNAMKACRSLNPGGGIMVQGGNPPGGGK